MSLGTMMAKIDAKHRQRIIDICQEGRLLGSLVRNFYVVGQTWGMVKSLTLVDGELRLQAGDREEWGHGPFDEEVMFTFYAIA